MVVSAAISKHIYISVNRTFTDDYFLKYSASSSGSTSRDQIEHPIIREVLRAHDIGPRVEIVSHRRHPLRHRAGLVGLVHRRACSRPCTPCSATTSAPPTSAARPARSRSSGSAARSASRTSTSRRSAASPASTSTRTARVDVAPARLSSRHLHDLEEHLLMFFTGYSRAADEVLAEQVTKSHERRPRDDRQPALRQGPRAAQPGRARERRRRRLRRPDARALGEQEAALRLDVQPAHRPLLRRRPRRTAPAAASWSAPAPAGS